MWHLPWLGSFSTYSSRPPLGWLPPRTFSSLNIPVSKASYTSLTKHGYHLVSPCKVHYFLVLRLLISHAPGSDFWGWKCWSPPNIELFPILTVHDYRNWVIGWLWNWSMRPGENETGPGWNDQFCYFPGTLPDLPLTFRAVSGSTQHSWAKGMRQMAFFDR
jgi:hypothetical protein